MATEWQTIMEGVRERTLTTRFKHLRIHYTADPLKRGDWSENASLAYFGKEAPKWRREQEIDYKAYSGQRLWPMLGKIHLQQRDLREGWSLYRVIDQGIRHPTVCLWFAVNARGDRHFFREYYSTNRSIAMNCRAIIGLTSRDEHIHNTFIDPSTRKRSEESVTPLISIYSREGVFCTPADNSFAGYDSVASAALSTLARYAIASGEIPTQLNELSPSQDQLLTLAQKPAISFDPRFTSRCFEESCNLRWRESKGDETQNAPQEKPVDKDDDGPDCVRYAIQTSASYRALSNRDIQIQHYKTMSALKGKKRSPEDMILKMNNRARIYA